MEYISERITNIAGLEALIERAYIEISIAIKLLEEGRTPLVEALELLKIALDKLREAKEFELHIEQRRAVVSNHCE